MKNVKSMKEYFINESNDFILHYAKDIKKILKKVSKYSDMFVNATDDELQEIANRLEKKLNYYDNEVMEFVIDSILFGGEVTVNNIVEIGQHIENNYGTEKQMIIYAYEDVFAFIKREYD